MAERKLITYDDDILITPEIGRWSEEKYTLLKYFVDIFSTGMKQKMNKRVFIDLFAGSGKAKFRGTNTIVGSSPFIALSVNDPFDKYIFCEKDINKLEALKERTREYFPNLNTVFIQGDCNSITNEIISEIPTGKKILSFCFVDPFNIGIDFETIKQLSTNRAMDFLILLALGMDANRNRELYSSLETDRIDKFLGMRDWREKQDEDLEINNNFRRFLMRMYSSQMEKIGYLPDSLVKMEEVKHGKLNLYHLAFFSKHKLGYKFWEQARKYGTNRLSLDF